MDVVPKIRLAALTAVLLAWPTAQPAAEPDCSTAAECRALASKLEFSPEYGQTYDYDAFLPLYHKACELGGASSCGHLGKLYERGDIFAPRRGQKIQRDLPEAGRLLRAGCLGGDAPACGRLELLTNRAAILAWNLPIFCDGHGVYHFADLDFPDQDIFANWDAMVADGLEHTGEIMGFLQGIDRRLSYHRRACALGDGLACGGLGVLYAWGTFPVIDGEPNHGIRRAAEYLPLLRQGCEAGHGCACYVLSKELTHGGDVEPDLGQAFDLLRRACDGGSFIACRDLGTWFDRGHYGVDRDLAEAARLLRRACDGGDPHGCYLQGWNRQQGRGVERDETKAVRLFRKACDGGSVGGCGNLGRAFLNGRGVERDEAEAARFFHQACESWDASSCSYLGILHLHGQGVEQDTEEAIRLLNKACDRENANACSVLGGLLLQGDLAARDYVEGSRLMARATGLQVRDWLRNPGSVWTDARSAVNRLTKTRQ